MKYKRQLKLLQVIKNTIKAKYEAKFAFSNLNAPPIIIYQMGKVGSSTVYRSLKNASISNPILHLHFLSDDLPKHRTTHKLAGIDPPPYHIYLGEATRKVLVKHREFPIKIITLVRDPIAFIISDIFQNPYFAEKPLQTDAGSLDPQKFIKYIERELSKPDKFNYIYNWFDRELKTVFGIDVFSTSFPLEIGYSVYSKVNVEALVIRLEDLSEKGPKAISEFLRLENPLILRQSNVRSALKEKGVYNEVLERISLSPSLSKNIYSNKFVKHFYNEAMINKFISKWTNKK